MNPVVNAGIALERMESHARTLERELTAANARIAELERDKVRLDWLEASLCYAMVSFNGTSMCSLPSGGSGWENGRLRTAIDAAMQPPPNNLPHA